MMPAGTYDVTENMKTAGDAIVKGGQTKLFTPMMLFVAKKVSRSFGISDRWTDDVRPSNRFLFPYRSHAYTDSGSNN